MPPQAVERTSGKGKSAIVGQDMLRFGELFAGAGGMALGLKRAGFEPAWAVDWNADACQTYRNMIGGHAICDKVENIRFSDLAPISGLAFGFPCNDFSMVGERKGTQGYFGGLYKFAEQAIRELQPTWFIAENVPGLLASGGHDIMQEFANAGPGYRLSVHVYRFEEYGVPQKRWRVIGVGVRSDLGLTYYPPSPTHSVAIGAKEALEGVEAVIHNNELPRHSEKVTRLLRSIPPGENCWHSSIPEELRLNVEKVRMSLIYRRLHPDLPSYTIVGSGGGGTHGYHFEEPRALTNRERARLQSFPDEFVFSGSPASVRKQIGMAVPPLGAECIGRALLNTLQGTEYAFTMPSVGVFDGFAKSHLAAVNQPMLFEGGRGASYESSR